MSILSLLNSGAMYLICGSIILFVALVCVLFAVRAFRAGLAIGMDRTKLRRTVTASLTFSVLPSVGILLGVIALSGSLGTPGPWLRVSVIGALHYETQVAEAAAEAVGLPGLSASAMTAEAFSTIALLMSVCIIWGMIFCLFTCKKYAARLSGTAPAKAKPEKAAKPGKKKLDMKGFGDSAMTAMFIGLVSAYIGSYIGTFVSGGDGGVFSFSGSWLPLAVAAVAALAMGVFTWLRNRFKAEWIDSFSIAGSMLIAMASAIAFAKMM